MICAHCAKPIARCLVSTCGIGYIHTRVSTLQTNEHYCYPVIWLDQGRVRAWATPAPTQGEVTEGGSRGDHR